MYSAPTSWDLAVWEIPEITDKDERRMKRIGESLNQEKLPVIAAI